MNGFCRAGKATQIAPTKCATVAAPPSSPIASCATDLRKGTTIKYCYQLSVGTSTPPCASYFHPIDNPDESAFLKCRDSGVRGLCERGELVLINPRLACEPPP